MFRNRRVFVAGAALFLMLGSISTARAQSGAGTQSKVVRAIARAVMTAARPSTFSQDLEVVSHELSILDGRRIDVNFVVNWKGAATGNPYQSRFSLKAYLGDGKLELVGLTYRDNARSVHWNQKNLDRLVPVVNGLLDLVLRQ